MTSLPSVIDHLLSDHITTFVFIVSKYIVVGILLRYVILPSTDMDECSMAGVCGPQEQCENTPGSYTCIYECGKGFRRTSSGMPCEGKAPKVLHYRPHMFFYVFTLPLVKNILFSCFHLMHCLCNIIFFFCL